MNNHQIIKQLSFKQDISPLLKMAIPLVLTGGMQSSLNFFENIFLAHLGPSVLAAGALVSWLFATLIVVLFGTFSAVNIIIAHQYGANDTQHISNVVRDGFLLGILLLIPTFLLFWNMAPIFLLFGQSEQLVNLAVAYLHALAWGLLPKFVLIVLFEMLLGIGHIRTMTLFTVVTTPLYIFFSYVLIFGKFGFPRLEIAGAGWGMTLGDWLSAVFMVIIIFCNKRYAPYVRSIFNFSSPSYLWEIFQIGLPMGVMYCVEVGFFFAMTLVMGLIDVHTLAANQLTMQYLGPLMGLVFCIAQSVTVRMGHQLGANQIAAAERTSYAGIFIAIVYMSLTALVYIFFPNLLIALDFNSHNAQNVQTIVLARQFLFIAAFFQMAESIRIVLFGALRSLKDTRFTLYVSIFSFWGIALPLGYLGWKVLHMGGAAFWCAMLLSGVASVILLYYRFNWKIRARSI